jgi:DNA-binding NarL/FixJ family response regulator
MADRPIRVLLVDDQELVRAGFRVILSTAADIEVVGEAANGQLAVQQAAALRPDVVCMDVQMPGMDGLAATRAITADPEVGAAVLILTTFDRDDYLFDALRGGASGFLLKNASPEQLLDAIRVIAAGDALLSPTVTRRVIGAFSRPAAGQPGLTTPGLTTPGDAGRPGRGDGPSGLTERETDVLRLLAQGLSNAEIARTLFVGEATVKTHVSNVLAKLGVRDRMQAVIYAYEHRIVVPAG